MAGGMRKIMVYLGLVDDEYDEYDDYQEPQPAAAPQRPVRAVQPVEDPGAAQAGSGTVRPMPRESAPPDFAPAGPMNQGTMAPAPRPTSRVQAIPPVQASPVTPISNARPAVVEPKQFADAQAIGDRLKGGQPVIVSLADAEADLTRRLIDFCSGATYVLDATMKKVARNVFLLTPANVEVSADDKRRLQERGLYNPS